MSRLFAAILLSVIMAVAHADNAPPTVGFSIVKTGSLRVREALVFAGGDLGKEVETIFSAVLVKHGEDTFLFDTGLGSNIADQYRQDMPLWNRPFFRYEDPVAPARTQLDKAGVAPVRRVFLSHSHWDHASGVADFPEAEVWVPEQEMAVIRQPASALGGAWPSQVGAQSIQWKTLAFKPVPYEGFSHSADLFDDGKVVLVPMFGHTPGSIGMFVKVDSGKRYFFVGDVVWNAGAVKEGRPKFWPARIQVDKDAGQTQRTVDQVRALVERDAELVVVPAHDGAVQQALGFFPAWIR
ncbi:MBL fold metallo-hydrolase [Noviherbaspirillum sp. ST9]|uniref:MBL fold metallo-hydrolase n=1 Tax=Noviherbaspirillum sp. ST9 TaxID=3401606 RepID=UPI003B588123